jgi:hypothetical protein
LADLTEFVEQQAGGDMSRSADAGDWDEQSASDTLPSGTDKDATSSLAVFFDLAQKLAEFWRLYVVVMGVAVVFMLLSYVVVRPTYTAIATIGPPNPSPVSTLNATVNGGVGGTSGMARRLLGGASGAGNANDPFMEYQQLLKSQRLLDELVARDHILPRVFYMQWDASTNTWKKPGLIHRMLVPVKELLHRPNSEHPDANSLRLFLDRSFSITPVTNARSISSLSLGSSYVNVSLSFTDRHEAEVLLDTILRRADEIIRQEQLRDVTARIAFIKSELQRVTESEQREALIGILSGQEQLQTMMVADQRFASTLVDTPHAAPKPTKPQSPGTSFVFSAFVSLVIWVALVLAESKISFLHRFVARFRRSGENRTAYMRSRTAP